MNLLENKIKQTNIFHTMYFNNIPSPNSSKILPTSLSLPNFIPSFSLSLKKSPGKEQQNKIKLNITKKLHKKEPLSPFSVGQLHPGMEPTPEYD